MQIRVVSTLTPEDEEQVADAVLAAVTKVLEQLPIAYSVRLEANDTKVSEKSNLESTIPGASSLSGRPKPH